MSEDEKIEITEDAIVNPEETPVTKEGSNDHVVFVGNKPFMKLS